MLMPHAFSGHQENFPTVKKQSKQQMPWEKVTHDGPWGQDFPVDENASFSGSHPGLYHGTSSYVRSKLLNLFTHKFSHQQNRDSSACRGTE
jgi:hypothetical protein